MPDHDQTYIFEGGSDDTFGEYNVTNDDYDNCASGEAIKWALRMPDGSGLLIVGVYGDKTIQDPADGWLIGVASLKESAPVDWPVTMEPSAGEYRNRLRVVAPADAVLHCLNREKDNA